jgi:O-acetylserine/cysteine efflux transporter
MSVPLIWGLGFTLAKAGMGEFPPILLTALRFSLTALVLVWFVRPPWGMMTRIFWVALVGGTIQYSLTFTGLNGMDASTAIIIVQLEVPFTLMLSVIFLKDRLDWRQAFGVALAFGGVVMVAGEPRLDTGYLPVVLVIAGTFTWAIGQILVKTVHQVGGFALIAWVAVFSAPQLFLASFLFEDGQAEAVANAGWIGWGAIIYLGLVMTAVGYAAWYHVLGRYPVTKVMPFLMLLPVTTIACGVVLLDETLTPVTMAGAVIVIVGVAFITIRRSKLEAEPDGEPEVSHPLTLDDAKAIAEAYRTSLRDGSLDLVAMEEAAAAYLGRYPGTGETDARIFVADLIVRAGKGR